MGSVRAISSVVRENNGKVFIDRKPTLYRQVSVGSSLVVLIDICNYSGKKSSSRVCSGVKGDSLGKTVRDNSVSCAACFLAF